jgi:hypothetical protein
VPSLLKVSRPSVMATPENSFPASRSDVLIEGLLLFVTF